ncbi:hypothetical protein JCM10207_007227 [Rhodosporidiobolus poonsookiae]
MADGPFTTPTLRTSNPLLDSLNPDEATPRAPPAPSIAPSSSRLGQTSPPASETRSPPRHMAHRPPPHARTRSPPAKRPLPPTSGAVHPHPQTSSPPPRPAQRPHPQSHSSHHAQQPSADELDAFSLVCRRLYYHSDPSAARQVDQTLAKLPPSFRSAYARTMAAVRSDFHRDEELRRRTVVEELLASTVPGGVVKRALLISPESTSTAAMRSSSARKLRRDGLRRFLDSNCVKSMPGPHPFFRSMFAALWLQGLDTGKGGAGERCVEWEVDLAVFSEAGGGEGWAKEAIEALKGVLGMTERVSERSETDSNRTSFFESTIASSSRASSIVDHPTGAQARSGVDEHGILAASSAGSPTATASGTTGTASRRPAPPVPPHRGSTSLRTRSKSDPFLTPEEKAAKKPDGAPPPPSSDSVAAPLSPASPLPPSPDPAVDASTPFLAGASSPSAISPSLPPRQPSQASQPALAPAPLKPQFRTFTLPSYLTDPEARSLCRLFPDFISAPAKPAARFRSNSASKAAKAKAVAAAAEEGKEPGAAEGGAGPSLSKVGHGELRVGRDERAQGWRGGWWERWVGWWKALFGRA